MSDITSVTSKLQTLADRPRCAPQKPSKAARGVAEKQAKSADDRKLRIWAQTVKKLDDWTDRYTGKFVKKTGPDVSVVHPDAGHAHHIEPRANEDTRYDVRNGVTLSFASHDAVERGELRIVGTKWFVVNKRKYINGREPLKFVKVK